MSAIVGEAAVANLLNLQDGCFQTLWRALEALGGDAFISGGMAATLGAAAALGVGVLGSWTAYLAAQPAPAQVRATMLGVVFAWTVCELALCRTGCLRPWMGPLVLLMNCWGPVDAALRYPAVHDIDSLFAVKQLTLLCGKLASLPFGFVNLLDNLYLLASVSCVNFCVLPVLYVIALPFDQKPEDQRRIAKGVVDDDIAIRFACWAADAMQHHKRLSRPLARVLCGRSRLHKGGGDCLPLWESALAGGYHNLTAELSVKLEA